MEQQIGFISKLTGGILALLGAAFGLGKYNSCVVKKQELYKDDGSLIYLTTEQARKNIQDCRNTMSKELGMTHKKLDKIAEYLKEQNARQMEISEFIGAAKQFMRNNK